MASAGTEKRRAGGKGAGELDVSVVVPAYKEEKNLRPLTERLFKALDKDNLRGELIVVDDNSKDGSVEVVAELAKEGYPVRIIVRTNERGLSSAVLRGFDEAKGPRLICMDADLQHDPAKVPELVAALDSNAFVLGTRYGKGTAVDKDWPLHRHIISAGARSLARPLSTLTDPMSGFFGVRAPLFREHRAQISGLGFKVGLEIYIKCGAPDHAEVPFNFGARVYGTSKLTGGVMIQYLQHLGQLYMYKSPLYLVALIVIIIVALYTLRLLLSL